MSVIEQSLDSAANGWDDGTARGESSARTRRRVGLGTYRAAMIAVDGVITFGLLSAATHYIHDAALSSLVALVGTAVFVVGVALGRGYSTGRSGYGAHEYLALLRGTAALSVAVLGASFLGLLTVPPGVAFVAVGGVWGTTTVLRAAARGVLGALRSRGKLMARAVVVAGGGTVQRAVHMLSDARQGRSVVGVCVPGANEAPDVAGFAVLPDLADVVQLAQRGEVDSVVLDPRVVDQEQLRRFRWAMERTDTEVLVTTSLHDVLPGRIDMQILSATPVLELRVRPDRSQRIIKTVFDRVVAGTLLLLASPILLAAMIGVRLTSKGPAIFRQVRAGVDGRPFVMLKLRSMTVDAEERRVHLDNADGAGPLFKMHSDPRVTPIGKVLRRSSIDELPQLWNVLRGDMSLVGPRPPLPQEVLAYDSMAVHRLHVRPGLTGLWQVGGRSDLSWDAAVRLDLLYVDNWSVMLDLKILWRTARAVLGAEGAY